MQFAYIEKTSLLDYPGKVCSVLFTVGCSFRCPFCYNRNLVLPEEYPAGDKWSEGYAIDLLNKRKKYVDAVTITGGEPLMHEKLVPFLKRLKENGFNVKIDTNGSQPERLKEIIDNKLADYIAMDLKNCAEKYKETSGSDINPEIIKRSADMIMGSGIDYEFRVTLVPGLHTIEDLEAMMKWISGNSGVGPATQPVKRIYLQPFRNDVPLINSEYNLKPLFKDNEIDAFQKALDPFCKEVKVRKYY